MVQEALNLLSQAQIIRGALREVASVVDEQVVADANSVLAGIENLAAQLSIHRTPLHEQIATRAAETFSPALGQLRASVTGGDFSGIQEDAVVLEDLYSVFLEDLDQRLESNIEEWPPEAWSLQNFLSSQNREYKQNRELRGAITQARESLSRLAATELRAEQSASNAAEAAGVSGQSSLAEHFAAYAKSELKAANGFRWATLVALALAAGVALAVPYSSLELASATRHALQVIALGGLGTFLGTQAGSHRRIGNWAKSIEVQLKSFKAFVDPIADEDAVGRLYEVLGARVLGSPPGASRSSAGEQQFLAKAVDLIGRRAGSGS